MSDLSQLFLAAIWSELGGDARMLNAVRFTQAGGLPSTFAVTDLASGAVAAAALSVAEIIELQAGTLPSVVVDRRLVSFWFGTSLRPLGWAMPSSRDPITGDYRTRDGWIRLHANAPHHRASAERVLGYHSTGEAMAAAVATWRAAELEQAIVAGNGCAAEMRSMAKWNAHSQGKAIATDPLIHVSVNEDRTNRTWAASRSAPLAALRVLDLTRVLAGPVASRFLAGFGADVLRIDPPQWDEPGVVPEVTLGKRCARLDLRTAQDRAVFEALLADADVLLHGYRPDALDRLGYRIAARREISPGLIDVCLNAYGWSGPWEKRRGFDSLVQMSAGIAEAGMRWRKDEKPVPLPVQALDHATGYMLAATVVRALARRWGKGRGTTARLSLARTAKLLADQGAGIQLEPLRPEDAADQSPAIEQTAWGKARRLAPPVDIAGCRQVWAHPASALGSAEPRWT